MNDNNSVLNFSYYSIYKRKFCSYIKCILKCTIMENYIKKVELHAHELKDQLYRARCNKCCLLEEWTESFRAVSDFKKYHEIKHPHHHVYIDVK